MTQQINLQINLNDVRKGSYCTFCAEDFLSLAFSVNKRVNLVLTDVGDALAEKVKAKLIDFYGADKTIYIFENGFSISNKILRLDDLSGGFDCGVLAAEALTEHKRFDFSDLEEIMKKLRADGGCEWDRAQTHESIRINLIEEAYELVEAIDCKNAAMMREETGDVMLQAVFHSELAEEYGEFNFADMFTELCRKLLDRHTHIFGQNHADNAEQALGFWTEAKKKEKKYTSNTDAMNRVPKNLPSLLYAEKIQKIAKKCGFDWHSVDGAAEKVGEELNELMSAETDKRVEEAGDLLFAVCNVLRFYKVEPELALRGASQKFLSRFAVVEKLATADGKEMTDYTLEELDKFWAAAKAEEKNK